MYRAVLFYAELLFMMAPTKRFAMSFEANCRILDRLDRGVRVIDVAHEYKVNESTRTRFVPPFVLVM